MDRTRLKLVVPFALITAFAVAQDNTPPKVSLSAPKTIQVGVPTTVTLSMTFAPGLHGYQNPPLDKSQIPVTVTSGGKAIKIKSIKYPKGTLFGSGTDASMIYEGTIKIPVSVIVSGKPGTKASVQLTVNYQQCYETGCFRPTTVSASAPVKLVAKKGG